MISRKIEQENCFIIQQIVNEMYFTARESVVRQRIVRFQKKLDDLSISQDICYVQMTDITHALTIYGHHANLGAISEYPTIYLHISECFRTRYREIKGI